MASYLLDEIQQLQLVGEQITDHVFGRTILCSVCFVYEISAAAAAVRQTSYAVTISV